MGPKRKITADEARMIAEVLTEGEQAWLERKLAEIAELEELMSDGLQARPIPMADAIRLGLVKTH